MPLMRLPTRNRQINHKEKVVKTTNGLYGAWVNIKYLSEGESAKPCEAYISFGEYDENTESSLPDGTPDDLVFYYWDEPLGEFLEAIESKKDMGGWIITELMEYEAVSIYEYTCEDCGATVASPAIECCDSCVLKFYREDVLEGSFMATFLEHTKESEEK